MLPPPLVGPLSPPSPTARSPFGNRPKSPIRGFLWFSSVSWGFLRFFSVSRCGQWIFVASLAFGRSSYSSSARSERPATASRRNAFVAIVSRIFVAHAVISLTMHVGSFQVCMSHSIVHNLNRKRRRTVNEEHSTSRTMIVVSFAPSSSKHMKRSSREGDLSSTSFAWSHSVRK